MKPKLKRIVSIILALAMTFCMVQGIVFAYTYVAQITVGETTTKYETLAAAIASATDGVETTITMIGDETIEGNAGVTIPANKRIILDLNGYTIKNAVSESEASQVIKNNGTLVIKDSKSNGTITNDIKEGTEVGDWFKTPKNNWTTNVVDNNGVLTVESGNLINVAGGNICYAVDNNGADGYAPVFYFKGGLLKSNYAPLRLAPGSGFVTLDMADGTVEGKYGIALNGNSQVAPKYCVNIKGGVIKANTYAIYESAFGNVTNVGDINMRISGGFFGNGNITGDDPLVSTSHISGYITGGYYTSNVSQYVAPGYVCVSNTDADTRTAYPYVVKAENPVAQIGNVTYASLSDAIEVVQPGETITMIKDVVLDKEIGIPAEKDFTLDLNGKTISNNTTNFTFTTTSASNGAVPARFVIIVEGKMIIQDTSSEHSGKINISNVGGKTTKAILVKNNGDVTVNSGEIYGEYAAFYVVGYTGSNPETTEIIPVLTANGGIIHGKAVGVGIKGKTATVTINEGANILGETDYGVCTNGTTDWYNGGNSRITIHGGSITSSGQALYFPAESVVVIDGGTISGGSGLVVKGGKVTVSGSVSLEATGEKGDPGAESSGAKDTGDALYIEDTYDNHTPIVTVLGGKFKSNNGYAVQYFTNKAATANNKGLVALTGGYYDEDVKGYVADGYVCVSNTDAATKADYPYVVKKAAIQIPGVVTSGTDIIVNEETGQKIEVKVASETDIASATDAINSTLANPAVTKFENTNLDVATTVTDATIIKNVDETSFNLSMILDAIKKQANEQFANDSSKAVANGQITIQASTTDATATFTDVDVAKQIKVDLTAASVETVVGEATTTTVTEMTFEVKPVATVIVSNGTTTEKVTAIIPNEAITAPITFRLPVDNSVSAKWAEVFHEGKSMGYYEILCDSTNGKYIQLSSQKFSKFGYKLLDSNATIVASIGTVGYPTLQAAVDAVENNGTIKLEQNVTTDVTVSTEKTFTIDLNTHTFSGSVKPGAGYKVEKNNNTYTVSKKAQQYYYYDGPSTPSTPSAPAAETPAAVTYANCTKDDKCPISNYVDLDPAAWYHNGLHFCLDRHYVQGINDTHFNPAGSVTRAEFATLIYNIEGKPSYINPNTFKDVPAGQFYTDAVVWAAGKGLITGYDNGVTFGPNDLVTREMMAQLLYKYAVYKGYVKESDTADVNTLSFDDIFEISDWAKSGIHWCLAKEVMIGEDEFVKPKNNAVRIELPVLVMNFYEKLELEKEEE